MPMTEFKGAVDCVVCPALEKKVEKVKQQREKAERERVRVILETQLLQQRKLAPAKKNRLFEKARHLNEVSAHLASQVATEEVTHDEVVPETSSVSESADKGAFDKMNTCQTGASTVAESPRAEASSSASTTSKSSAAESPRADASSSASNTSKRSATESTRVVVSSSVSKTSKGSSSPAEKEIDSTPVVAETVVSNQSRGSSQSIQSTKKSSHVASSGKEDEES